VQNDSVKKWLIYNKIWLIPKLYNFSSQKKIRRKIMRKTAIIALSALVLLGTSAYACMGKGGPRGEQGSFCQKQNGHKGFGSRITQMATMLSLSDKQQTQLDQIVQKYAPKRADMASFFTEKGFDKESYLKMVSQKKDDMMKQSAFMIDEVYALLDDSQKQKFKTLIQAQQIKMDQRGMQCGKKGARGDQSCNGRR
jgi:Spy/CpxP family protein refolding chaperone